MSTTPAAIAVMNPSVIEESNGPSPSSAVRSPSLFGPDPSYAYEFRFPGNAFMRVWEPGRGVSLSRDGACLLGHMEDVAAGGADRVVLTWPSPPESVIALHGLEALRRQTEGVTSLTTAIFPARPSMGARMRSVLVDRDWVRRLALERVNAWGTAEAAVGAASALRDHDLMLLRLKDAELANVACSKGRPAGHGSRAAPVPPLQVRHPSLSELFPVFYPDAEGCYGRVDGLFLDRMRRCTMLGRTDFKTDEKAASAMDRDAAPFRCFALPGDSAKRWIASLRQPCLTPEPLDVLLVDLTQRGRITLGVLWSKTLKRFLGHVDQCLVRHPPRVMMVTDSPFIARTAMEILSDRTSTWRCDLTWPKAVLAGVLSRTGELFGDRGGMRAGSQPFKTTVVLRDNSLANFRDASLALARKAEQGDDDHRALGAAVRRCYDFVRRAAGLPCGLKAILFT